MNITVIGAGYVGLVTGTCFAELGNHVTCVDIDVDKITNLKKGELPFYEPGLETLVLNNIKEGRLQFVSHFSEILLDPQVIFIAVGTPSEKDGSADIKYVLEAASDIGAHIKKYCVIVDKSTVPVGMADQVRTVVERELKQRNLEIEFDIVSNPEFLREGAAIEDFMRPDRVIIGLESKHAESIMLDLYIPLLRSHERLFFMNIKDAEMTKYAANAMLATRISFMNELALICDEKGVDIENVRVGIGSDSRIGSKFLHSGCGYGGSCFPKDVRALMKMAEQSGVVPLVLRAVEARNFQQKHLLAEKMTTVFGDDLSHLNIGIWGLAFKPETDDMREASSLVLIADLLARGAKIRAYDPVAMPTARAVMPEEWFADGQLTLVDQQYDALHQVDALVLVTEWKPFCYPNLTAMKNAMRHHIIFDGRNQYDPKAMYDAGFLYYGIGRGSKALKALDAMQKIS